MTFLDFARDRLPTEKPDLDRLTAWIVAHPPPGAIVGWGTIFWQAVGIGIPEEKAIVASVALWHEYRAELARN